MKILLTIEKSNNRLWGRMMFKNDLLTDYATNIPSLEKKMARLLKDFYKVKTVEFTYAYDLVVFFEEFDFLNQSKIAELAGVNPGLLRQYASGIKNPSLAQAKKIEKAVHELAKELQTVSIGVPALRLRTLRLRSGRA